uniref:Uncharacterized protein n=1 Tax=Anopheles christyi TaxID=43041 RepID=A0A182KIB0_9DIPT
MILAPHIGIEHLELRLTLVKLLMVALFHRNPGMGFVHLDSESVSNTLYLLNPA